MTHGIKHGIDESVLTKWKYKVISKVAEKNKKVFNNISVKYYKKVLQQKDPLHTLNILYNELVVIPVDKTNDKVGFISQRYYALVLLKELGLDRNTANTYKT